MNRKTNIFYSTGINSNFLTFDNYTDALTGDILAINQKLFPSHFLCCYIKDLDIKECGSKETYNANKKEFIQDYLSPYYENKLAVLRDYIDAKNDPTSSNHSDDIDTSTTAMQPFGYLIMLLYYYVIKKNNLHDNITTPFDIEQLLKTNISLSDNDLPTRLGINNINDYINFPFFGDIIEYDYTGTYTDIICTISPSNRKYPVFNLNSNVTGDNFYTRVPNPSTNMNLLYGWQTNDLNTNIREHIQKQQINDENNAYVIQNIIESISENDLDVQNNSIKFNVIIPLYTSINMDNYEESDETTNELLLNDCVGVPIGMYFSENPIELDGSSENYSSNWSLLISTQFKPFPYSFNIINNESSPNIIKDAYITFAEILSKQTNYVDMLNKYNELMINLQNKISKLESIINNMGTEKNIDELYARLTNLENSTNNKYNELNNKIDELMELIQNSRLTWRISNNN